MLKKKKPKEVLGISEDLPEGIFGDTSMREANLRPRKREGAVTRAFFGYKPTLRLLPKKLKKAKIATKKKKKKPRYVASTIPQFQINYDSVLPKEAEGLPMQNVVGMTENSLKTIIQNTERFTNDLSSLLLQGVTPSVLSFDASSNYVRAVLKSGLKIDMDVDHGVLEAVQSLARIEVLNFYISRMSVPEDVKARLREKFVDGLTGQALDSMAKLAKSEDASKMVRELEAVLVKRSEAKEGEKNARSARKPPPTSSDEIGLLDSTRRSRKDRPLIGGF